MTFTDPSRADYSRNSQIGKDAEDAFESALRKWFSDGTQAARFIRIEKSIIDTQSIDFRTQITWRDDPHYVVPIGWQVKMSDRGICPPSTRISRNAAERICSDKNPTLIVCGVRKAKSELLRSHDDYVWYVIDPWSYLREKYKLKNSTFSKLPKEIILHFPAYNRLNCCLASIIWGALWFKKNLDSVRGDEKLILANHKFLEHICGGISLSNANLKQLRDMCATVMNDPAFAGRVIDVNAVFGPTYIASYAISQHQRYPGVDYLNFAAEGLSPAFNSWLFAKSQRY